MTFTIIRTTGLPFRRDTLATVDTIDAGLAYLAARHPGWHFHSAIDETGACDVFAASGHQAELYAIEQA